MQTHNDTQEEVKHFSEEEIAKEQSDFIKAYADNSEKPAKILFRLIKPHWRRLIVCTGLYALKVSPNWLVPLITANLINIAIQRPENMVMQVVLNVGLALAAYAMNVPLHAWNIKHFSIANRSIEAGLRGAMIRKLQQLSISFHKEMQSGRIHSKVMRDVESVEGLFTQLFNTVMNVLFSCVVSVAVILTKNPLVFALFLLTIPLEILLLNLFNKKIRENNNKFRKEIETTSSKVMDMLEMVPVTRAHALEEDEIAKMTNQVRNVAARGYKLDVVQSVFGAANWALLGFFSVICLAFSVLLAINGRIEVGDISLYQSYYSSLVSNVIMIFNLLPIFSRGFESLRSIGEILASYDVEDYEGKEQVRSIKGDYEFKNVHFHYPDDPSRPVLNDLSLKVNAGETIALVGESGAGKSTIVNLVIGFFKPTRGELYIDGKNTKRLDLRSYRHHLAVVPQNTILFSGTIRDNITYGRPDVSDAELQKVLEAANLKSVVDKLPQGLDTPIGEHGDKLSGGQRQRISIARAIIRKPDVIILDEATSALDTVSEAEIQVAMNNLTEGKTTFIVAHRLSTIRNADKIAVMRDGRCVEFGTYDELMAKKGEFYTFKTMQS